MTFFDYKLNQHNQLEHQMLGNLIWIHGLAGSGKTTLSKLIYDYFKEGTPNLVLLDGDELRKVIKNTDYSETGRNAIALQTVDLCALLVNQGIHVILANVSMYNHYAEWYKQKIPTVKEIYLRVPMSELVKRDQKKLYSKAIKGEILNVLGINQSFDEPINPDIIIDNFGINTINDSFAKLRLFICNNIFLNNSKG